MSKIIIKGARENNLKNIDLEIPRNKVVCFVGVSGSGKSTVAFDIIAREGERQYFESLGSFARRYLPKSARPAVDQIKGLSATIVVSQERVHGTPRSTVGTLTETYTYLRLLYSRVGLPSLESTFFSFNHPNGACPKCKGLSKVLKIDPQKVVNSELSLNTGALIPSEWKIGGRMWNIIRATHYFDMNKKIKAFNKTELHNLLYHPKELFQEETNYGANRWTYQGIITRMSNRDNSTSRGPVSRDHTYYSSTPCPQCQGGRLNQTALAVKINNKNIAQVANLPLDKCLAFIKSVPTPQAQAIKPRLESQLQHLIGVGLDYLTLNRSTDTLSGGEAQRVKIARQLGCDLTETIYVLDEPTAGLHPRDTRGIITNLQNLKAMGNTVLIIEHDQSIIEASDHIIELGPGGGKKGGEVVATGSVQEIRTNPHSLTGHYLNRSTGQKKSLPRQATNHLLLNSATKNNLKNISLAIPTEVLVALTGVSGSGKSSLVEEIIAQHPSEATLVGQDPIGTTKRGCIATYIRSMDEIRKIFALENHLHPSLFSFNSRGACQECHGLGFLEMEMNFLGDIKIKCDSCSGSRYKNEVLTYKYKDKNISEVLTMTAAEAKDFFDNQTLKEQLSLLEAVGLDYLEIGQTLDTLSGGEAQRLKLASHLQTTRNFLILDEPTSGLHFKDVDRLLILLNKLVEGGNTVLVVEHNLEVIRAADWIIDLGPEGGERGGYVIAQGPPQKVASTKASTTGHYLR